MKTVLLTPFLAVVLFSAACSDDAPTEVDLSGNALAALNEQNLVADGDYTLVATGSATSPTLFLLSNSFSGQLGS